MMDLDGATAADGLSAYNAGDAGDYFPVQDFALGEKVNHIATTGQPQSTGPTQQQHLTSGVARSTSLAQVQHRQHQQQQMEQQMQQQQQPQATQHLVQHSAMPQYGPMHYSPMQFAPAAPAEATQHAPGPSPAFPASTGVNHEAEPGYIEYLWLRRREVVKLVVISLVVLLAISSHSTVWHYLREYLDNADLTTAQELMLRLAYPLAVFVVLWHTKAFLSGPR
jgi:hypothetical protein